MRNQKYNIPIIHHYIPQYVLRRFCVGGKLNYYSKKTNEYSRKNTREVFYEKNLCTIELERDFSRFESEIAKLLSDKIIGKDKIELTNDEESKLRLFYALFGFRSINAKQAFDRYPDEIKRRYESLQQTSWDEMWRKNLSLIVNCRSLEEVLLHKDVDQMVKMFIRRDTYGIIGRYLSFVTTRGEYSFILGDCYPLCTFNRIGIPMVEIFPISPKQAIIMVNNEVIKEDDAWYKDFLKRPEQKNGIYHYNVRKIYDNNIRWVNKTTYDSSKIGCVYLNDIDIDFDL